MEYEGLLELMMKRRSVYGYKPDSLPDEFIDKIIEAARWAPSGANSQPWEFVVIKDKDLREKIVDLFKEQAEISYKVEQTRPVGNRSAVNMWTTARLLPVPNRWHRCFTRRVQPDHRRPCRSRMQI